jgi:hypothetical protein
MTSRVLVRTDFSPRLRAFSAFTACPLNILLTSSTMIRKFAMNQTAMVLVNQVGHWFEGNCWE